MIRGEEFPIVRNLSKQRCMIKALRLSFRRTLRVRISIGMLYFFIFGMSFSYPCQCIYTGNAFTALKSSEVVFLGRVIRDSGPNSFDGETVWGYGPGRMVVEKVFHGLPNDVREIEVDTAAKTSCYMHLELNNRYVVYGKRGKEPLQVTRDICMPSFNVRGQELLLNALIQAEAGGPSTLIGSVCRKKEKYGYNNEGVANVLVIAEGKQGRFETVTDPSGQFAFHNILPGSYKVRFESEDLLPEEEWPEGPSLVPIAGGTEKKFLAWPNGTISGTVRDPNGLPLPGIPVQAFAFDQKSELQSMPLHEAMTDKDGRYALKGLPGGWYVIGVNGEKYRDRLPYPPTFYPRAKRSENAERVFLAELEQRSGIDLSVLLARDQTVIEIDARNADGSPLAVSSAIVENDEGIQRYVFSDPDKNKSGKFKVTVYRGENYILKLSKIISDRKPDGKTCCFTRQWTGEARILGLNSSKAHLKVVLHETPMQMRNALDGSVVSE
jgi:hypothetical protein